MVPHSLVVRILLAIVVLGLIVWFLAVPFRHALIWIDSRERATIDRTRRRKQVVREAFPGLLPKERPVLARLQGLEVVVGAIAGSLFASGQYVPALAIFAVLAPFAVVSERHRRRLKKELNARIGELPEPERQHIAVQLKDC